MMDSEDVVVSAESSTDDEDDDESSDDEPDHQRCRVKRQIAWCDTETEPMEMASRSDGPTREELYLQELENSTSRPHGNPDTSPRFGNRMQLWTRTSHYIGVYPDGKVRGTMDASDLHTHLELVSARFPGHLRIKGLLTNLYVAMNQKGRIYAEPVMEEDGTIFIEGIKGPYLTYLSRPHAHKGWYLAINKRGKMKNGKKTAVKQKAVQYMQRRKPFQ